ncbi:hypothetical protein MRX96_056286 [Rhipicephalus microplus]
MLEETAPFTVFFGALEGTARKEPEHVPSMPVLLSRPYLRPRIEARPEQVTRAAQLANEFSREPGARASPAAVEMGQRGMNLRDSVVWSLKRTRMQDFNLYTFHECQKELVTFCNSESSHCLPPYPDATLPIHTSYTHHFRLPREAWLLSWTGRASEKRPGSSSLRKALFSAACLHHAIGSSISGATARDEARRRDGPLLAFDGL